MSLRISLDSFLFHCLKKECSLYAGESLLNLHGGSILTTKATLAGFHTVLSYIAVSLAYLLCMKAVRDGSFS